MDDLYKNLSAFAKTIVSSFTAHSVSDINL